MISTESRMRRPSIESTLRSALTNSSTRADMREKLAMDDSQVSRILSGQAGITIDKLDAVIAAVGMVTTTKGYLDALARLAQTGAGCYCAREGLGDCGVK